MERTKFSRTFKVGRVAAERGGDVYVTAEIRTHQETSRETISHEKVTEWTELSLSGTVLGGSAGQIIEELEEMSRYAPGFDAEKVRQIVKVWRRWHLNGMRAGCIHQPAEWTCPKCGTENGWHLKPTYPKRGDACVSCGLNRWDVGKFPYVGGWHLVNPDGETVYAYNDENTARQQAGQPRAVILRTVQKNDPNPCPIGYKYGTAWLVEPLPLEVADQVKSWGGEAESVKVRDPYETQSEEFLQTFGLAIHMAFKGDRCPKWCDGQHTHGDLYRVTVKRTADQRRGLSFDFWNSLQDKEEGKRPSAYSVLSSLASEMGAPDNPDEAAEELGLTPSQAFEAVKFGKKLREFLTAEEREALSQIQ